MKLILVSAMVLLQLLGCQSKKEPEQESVVLKAQKLIDSNRAADAVILLSNYYIKNPENREVRLTLASAYAKMAGLTIDSYYDALYEKVFSKPLGKQNTNGENDDLLNESFVSQSGKSAEANRSLLALARILKTSLMISKAFINLPTIPLNKIEYLEAAIEILETTPNLSRGESLFAATLYIVYFKHLFLFDLVPNSTAIKDKKCYFDFSRANSSTRKLKQAFGLTLESVGRAYPSKKTDLNKMKASFFEAADTISENAKDLVVIDTLLEIFTGDRQIESELGRMFLCEP